MKDQICTYGTGLGYRQEWSKGQQAEVPLHLGDHGIVHGLILYTDTLFYPIQALHQFPYIVILSLLQMTLRLLVKGSVGPILI
jgi:hypothetical protein